MEVATNTIQNLAEVQANRVPAQEVHRGQPVLPVLARGHRAEAAIEGITAVRRGHVLHLLHDHEVDPPAILVEAAHQIDLDLAREADIAVGTIHLRVLVHVVLVDQLRDLAHHQGHDLVLGRDLGHAVEAVAVGLAVAIGEVGIRGEAIEPSDQVVDREIGVAGVRIRRDQDLVADPIAIRGLLQNPKSPWHNLFEFLRRKTNRLLTIATIIRNKRRVDKVCRC